MRTIYFGARYNNIQQINNKKKKFGTDGRKIRSRFIETKLFSKIFLASTFQLLRPYDSTKTIDTCIIVHYLLVALVQLSF